MTNNLPSILDTTQVTTFPAIVPREQEFLSQARLLLDSGFPDHALLDSWNAAVHNLRRRVEAYGVDLFKSAVKDESGRKNYDPNGDTVAERWAGVDDLVLISGATRLSLLNKKAGKTLEMTNWMRNHASPAHDSDEKVEMSDVAALALMLQQNLFLAPMPDPGHSPRGLFDPLKLSILDEESLGVFKDQINRFTNADLRVTSGFMLDLACAGGEPALSSIKATNPHGLAAGQL